MSDLFLTILNRSIAAGWVVLAVILARYLLRKAPKRVTCWLWLIVAARLLTAGFPQTTFSLIPSAQTITPESMFDREPVITSGVKLIDNVVNPIYTESFRANELASVNPLQVWTAVAANIWLLVMIAIWIWAFVSWLRLRRRVAASCCLRENIYICDAIDTPFILGMFRPRIYLPSTLPEEQRRHVVAHEQAHIARLDHWYKPFAYFLLSLNWFNPLMWVAYILLCRDIELACDESVIDGMNAAEKKGYSTALLDCSIHRHMIAACPLAFGEVGVKERVRAVLSYKKPAFWVVLIALAVCVALAVCFVTDPVERVPEIRWGGYLYVQEGDAVDHLPDKIQTFGELRSTLHDSTPHPTEDGQSVGLDWEYAGQPLYLVGNALYLENPGGGSWLKFVKSTENDPSQITYETFDMDDVSLTVGIPGGWEAETIDGTGYVGIRFRDKELSNGWISVKYWPDRQIHLNYAGIVRVTDFPSGLSGSVYYLNDSDADEGIWDKVYFYSDASFMSVEKPENYLWNTEYHEEAMDVIGSITVTEDGKRMFTTPNRFDRLIDGEMEYIAHLTDDGLDFTESMDPVFKYDMDDLMADIVLNGLTPSAQPDADLAYDLTISLCPSEDQEAAVLVHTKEQGWFLILHEDSGSDTIWQFDSTDLDLFISHYIANLDIHSDGRIVRWQEPGEDQLGITLTVESPTASGLILITTQEGPIWDTIYTGSNFSLARWDGSGWDFLPERENTAWTMVAYGVPLNETTRTGVNWEWVYGKLEPGQYRIYKSYTGERGFVTNRETAEETYYAEFTIE